MFALATALAITGPITVKLLTKFDRDKIFKNMNRLKHSNDEKKTRIFITDHLPKLFYNEKKQLMPEYKAAKEDVIRSGGQHTTLNIVCLLTKSVYDHHVKLFAYDCIICDYSEQFF